MTEVWEFPTAERTVELFLYCIDLLRVDDDGLAPENDLSDLNACALLCHMVKALTISPRDVLDVLLFDLADATEALIVTAVVPPDGDVSTRWAKARAAVASCQLGSLE